VVFLLAPAVGELVSGSTPLPEFLYPWVWLGLALLYGCGALLCRELALRWGTGWVGILLLGAAYGILEEGLVVRSFFDPNWQDLGALGEYGRSLGVNWLWSELLTLFHMAVSVGVTLALVELLFPGRRGEPWLGKRGMIGCGIGVSLWVAAGFSFYAPPALHLVVATLAVLLLGAAARWLRIAPGPGPGWPVPRPSRFFWLGLLGMAGVFLFTWIVADNAALPAMVTGIGMLAMAVAATWLGWRWSDATRSWDERHRLALVSGMLGFFLILGPMANGWAAAVVLIGGSGALWWLARVLARRARSVPAG
jgi:hypothetical protein